MADVVHYKYWTHQIATYGVSGAYSGEYPETAAIYPPVTMYGYRVAGWLYRHLYDPAFDMDAALGSHQLTVLVKLVAVVPQLVSILADLRAAAPPLRHVSWRWRRQRRSG